MSTAARPSVLVYAQHLSGVGHYVRTYEIARALTSQFEVHWIEGGRPVPHRVCESIEVIDIPRIRRGSDGALQALFTDQPLAVVQAERRRLLIEAIERLRPDVFLVEYFPFSKWELAPELLPAIQAVRNQGGMVLCSIRDIVRQTRFEAVDAQQHAARTIDWLRESFDALLVHADPELIRLESSFPAVAAIPVPIFYTGIVSETVGACPPATVADLAMVCQGRPYALVSAGGSAGGGPLIGAALEAWRDPEVAAGRLLVVCSDLSQNATELLPAGSAAPDIDLLQRIRLLPFRADFLHWLAAADLSISQCGYNTAANLLETGVRAVVSPHPGMSDQAPRAACLAQRHLLQQVDASTGSAALAEAIQHADRLGRRAHALRLDGAAQTCRIVAALLQGGGGGADSNGPWTQTR
jgi:predicted glycosyltransferase